MNHFTHFKLAQMFRSLLIVLIVLFLSEAALAQCPTVEAIMIDACGTEHFNEFVIINSGGGFNTSNLQFSFNISNNTNGGPNNDINIDLGNSNGPPCGLQPGVAGLINGCPNVISVGPGTNIPANSTIVLQTSSEANNPYDFSGVCGLGECIYVIQSTCPRPIGAFTNNGGGTGTVILALSSGGCSQPYTYDINNLIGGNSAYFIPPGTYGNSGCAAPPVTAGPIPPDFVNPGPQTACGSYTLPAITGTNLTGNESYFQLPNGQGGVLSPGQMITSTANIFIFDPTAPCSDAETFLITITPAPTANTPATPLNVCIQIAPPTFTENLATVTNEITGGNGSLMVNWYTDIAGTIPFNPNSVGSYPPPPTTLTIYATVDDGNCESATVPVTVNVNFIPTASPQSLTECDDGSGMGTFDLTSLDNTVSPGNTVTYYTNAAATNAIGNPGAYVSSGGTVYATATNAGGCTSAPVMITLNLVPALTTANTTITINPTSACGSAVINVTFNFPAAGTYDVILQYISPGIGIVNLPVTVMGMNPNPINIGITETTTFALISAGYNGTTCTYPFNSPTVLTATISTGPVIDDLPDVTQCGTYTLPPITGTNLNGNEAYYTGTGGTGTQFMAGQVISTSTTLFIYGGTAGCDDEQSVNINISAVPNLAVSGTLTYCEGTNINLSTLVNDLNNSGLPITFHSATPANAGNQLPSPNVSPSSSTTYFALIDGPPGCFDEVPISITITPAQTAQPAAMMLCATAGNTATFDLTTLNNTVSGGTGTVNWYQDAGLNNAIGNPASFNTGSTTVFATVTSGTCTSAPSSVVLTVNAAPTVTNIPPQQICGTGGGATFDLTTLENSIHNGTANQVTWFTDMSLATQIGNPAGYSTTGTTVYAVASLNGCDAAPVAVQLIVTDTAPPAQPVSPSACDNGSGQATFDLTLLESQMNVPAGFQVNWYSSTPPANPIGNPANYTGSGPVFATLSQASCTSSAIQIPLNILPVPTANPVAPINICDDGSGQALINLTDNDLQVNGGSGVPVIWYQDAAGNFPIGNPANFLTGTTTVFAAVDNGSCASSTIAVQITINNGPIANDAQLSICSQGANQATFDLTQLEGPISNGTGTVSWFFDTNGNTPIGNPNAFASPSIQVFAFVSNGVCTSAPATVTLTVNEIPTIVPLPTLITCNGANDGTLSIFVNGGQSPYIYDWSNDNFDGATDLTDLGPGVYSLTVTDNNLCQEIAMITITQPNALALDCGELSPVSTTGGSDGQAQITLSGGTAPYNISYTGPLTGVQTANSGGNITLNNLEAGNYNLTVVDANDCTISCSFTITDPDCALGLMITGTNLSCNGGADGTINLTITNGTMPYTIDWSDNALDGQEDPSGLMAGTYTVTVTDNTSCESTTSITLSQPPALNIVCGENFPVSMPGGIDGEAEVTISGGTAPFLVSWTGTVNGSQTQNTPGTFAITDLAAGNYTVLITDNRDCTIECDFVISDVVGCNLTLDIVGTEPGCYGDSTGTITLTINNATGPYEVIWTDEQYDGMENLSDVPAGSYATIVTDANGCEASTFIILGQPDSLSMSCGQIAPVTTPGGNDGQAGITVFGGTPPFQVNWTGPVSGSQMETASGTFSITDLEAGVYDVDIIDANGCTTNCTFVINAATCTLSLDINGTDPLCNGEASGSINLTITNATTPYVIDWNVDAIDGQENPSGLAAGTYSVTFTDADNCSALAEITLNDPAELIISCGQATPVSMAGGNDGTAEVSFTNGSGPYTISWTGPVSGSQTSATAGTVIITDLVIGNYTVTVTDDNGCSITCDFVITDVTCMISLDVLVEDASCADEADGKIGLTVLNGNQPYTFDWTPDILDGQQNPNNLAAGTYTVTVTDADGCVTSDTIIVGTLFDTPGVTLSPGGSICGDDCFIFNLEFTGSPPYNLTYNIVDALGPIDFTVDILAQDTTLEICAADFSTNNGFVTLNLLTVKNATCSADLTISEQLDLLTVTYLNIDTTLCAQESLVFNGITYDIDNPSGQDTLVSGNVAGCDSIINVNLFFFQEISSDLDTTICSSDSVVVGGIVFNEFNRVGSVAFPLNNGGCDSIVNVFLSIFPASEGEFISTLCVGDSLDFNGTIFNQSNPEGTVVLPGASAIGCDSLIKVTLTFIDSSSLNIQPLLCPGESIDINGVTYDENTPSGVQILEGAAANGCDSFLVITASFITESIAEITSTLCSADSLVINSTTYNINNPTGTEIFPGASVSGCDSIVNINLSFLPDPMGDFNPSICPSGSITFNGTVYDAANTSGTEILAGASVNGCDSIVNVMISFLPEPMGNFSPTLCFGESLVFNGTTYDANTPTGTETLIGLAANGCDSIVEVSLSFLPEPMGDFNPTVCLGESLVFNGTTYDANNPSGTEILVSASADGCDSTVNVTLSFLPEPMGDFNPTICFGASLDFNGTTYDANNPSGTEILLGASADGCDSTVNVTLSFLPEPMGDFTTTLCFGESLDFNGTTYDANNPTGTEILLGASADGCDSTVNVTLSFLPEPMGDFTTTLCFGESLDFNGTTYDANNPTGTEILLGASADGCDSTVNVTLNFFPVPIPGSLNPTICNTENLVFNGTTYDINNPTGTEVLIGASVDGCDSTVNVALSFFPIAAGDLAMELCPGESLLINNTIYDENNPTGTETLVGASSNGCDSLLNVSLSFLPIATGSFNTTLCEGENIVINGTTYDVNTPSGTEILSGAGSNGCDSLLNINLAFFPVPEAGLEGSASICNGESTFLIFRLSGGASFDLSYTDGVNPPVLLSGISDGFTVEVSPAATSTYSIVAASLVGSDCPVTLSTTAEIVVSQLLVDLAVTSDFDGFGVSCESSEDGAVQAEALQGVAPFTYVWSNGNLNPAQSGLAAGTYSVLVTDATGCTATNEVSLLAPPGIEANFTAASPLCFGDPTGSLQIDTVFGGSGPYEYSLNGEFFQTVGALPFLVNGVTPGSYSLSIQDANDCQTNIEALVPDAQQLLLDLGPDDEVRIGEPYLLKGIVNFEVASAQWTPADSLSRPDSIVTFASPLQTTTYILTAVDANGCSISDNITLFVNRERTVYIPNIFSPNEDGVNDFFGIFGGKDLVQVKIFRIFDRWGNLMFENGPFAPNDMSYGWDGTFQGKPMNPAVFVFYAELEFVDGETEIYKGDITLMR